MGAMTSTILMDSALRRAGTLPRMPRPYLWLAGLAMASGSVVFVEPAPYDIALILLLISGVVLSRLAFHAEHRVPLVLVAGFLAANAVSFAYVVDLRLAISYASANAYLAASWLLFAGLTSAHGSRSINVLMRGYTVAGLLAVVVSALAFFGAIPYQSLLLGAGRARGLFKDPNVFGPYLVPMLVYALARLQRSGPRCAGFWLNLAVCALATLGVLLSFSRAAWISCGVAIAGFFALQLISGILRRTVSARLVYSLLLIGLLVGSAALLAVSGESAISRMLAMRVGHSGLHSYDAVRFETHRQALETAMERPLGIGPGQSEVTFRISTHNMYLRILTETGVLGFVTFYGFVILSLARASKHALTLAGESGRDLFAVVSVCLLAILVNGLVIDTIHWRHFWFLLGLAWWVPAKTGGMEEEAA
jgi:O-antigen ligase